jgi:hypothetical protein
VPRQETARQPAPRLSILFLCRRGEVPTRSSSRSAWTGIRDDRKGAGMDELVLSTFSARRRCEGAAAGSMARRQARRTAATATATKQSESNTNRILVRHRLIQPVHAHARITTHRRSLACLAWFVRLDSLAGSECCHGTDGPGSSSRPAAAPPLLCRKAAECDVAVM